MLARDFQLFHRTCPLDMIRDGTDPQCGMQILACLARDWELGTCENQAIGYPGIYPGMG